ncbi:MAG: hypothetical protein FJX76_14140 [Armatimonadetes bacterium]|nr:hypothetical protein [Armatimonadota bacterium]
MELIGKTAPLPPVAAPLRVAAPRRPWLPRIPAHPIVLLIIFLTAGLAAAPGVRAWIVKRVSLALHRPAPKHAVLSQRKAPTVALLYEEEPDSLRTLPAVKLSGPRAAQEKARACARNLAMLKIALHNYYRAHDHAYPKSLNLLVKSKSMARLPVCPSAKGDSYAYRVDVERETYVICCGGSWHEASGIPRDHPRWSWPGRLSMR